MRNYSHKVLISNGYRLHLVMSIQLRSKLLQVTTVLSLIRLQSFYLMPGVDFMAIENTITNYTMHELYHVYELHVRLLILEVEIQFVHANGL